MAQNKGYGVIEAIIALVMMAVMGLFGLCVALFALCLSQLPLILAIIVALVLYNGCIA